jgi:hypothetical protein
VLGEINVSSVFPIPDEAPAPAELPIGCAAATGFVGAMSKEHGIDAATASNLRAATLEGDVIVDMHPVA